jgi:hypothetical protein
VGFVIVKKILESKNNIKCIILSLNHGVLEINDIYYELPDECTLKNISTCTCEWCINRS